MQGAGGVAALYIAVAYLAAIPYFVFLVNYPGVCGDYRIKTGGGTDAESRLVL